MITYRITPTLVLVLGVAAVFGLHWVFLVTAVLFCLNLIWVYTSVHDGKTGR